MAIASPICPISKRLPTGNLLEFAIRFDILLTHFPGVVAVLVQLAPLAKRFFILFIFPSVHFFTFLGSCPFYVFSLCEKLHLIEVDVFGKIFREEVRARPIIANKLFKVSAVHPKTFAPNPVCVFPDCNKLLRFQCFAKFNFLHGSFSFLGYPAAPHGSGPRCCLYPPRRVKAQGQ